MFYDPRRGAHGLAHNPITALVVPRPIGWISTIDRAGVVNLAPYSFFNLISGGPPFVMFASKPRKDSQRNAEETGEFVCNMATYGLRDAVNLSSTEWEPAVSEPSRIGLEMAPCRQVKPPRVARAQQRHRVGDIDAAAAHARRMRARQQRARREARAVVELVQLVHGAGTFARICCTSSGAISARRIS
jgi:flavin reductase (DIM6/NTAB) family NADH-FMN oxidoreductase RutF